MGSYSITRATKVGQVLIATGRELLGVPMIPLAVVAYQTTSENLGFRVTTRD